MLRRLTLPLLALVWLTACQLQPPVNGTVVGVHDGDTITVLTATKERLKIRLAGIDAPELGQAHGQASKQSLSKMVFGQTVRLRVTERDRYQRLVADVYVGETWVNLAQVENGYAWRYDQYSDDWNLLRAQVRAKNLRLGLWKDRRPKPPWDWRKARR